MWSAYIAVVAAVADAEGERRFYASVEESPIDMRSAMIAAHQKDRKDAQERARDNQRHREIVNAIRERSSPTVTYRNTSYGYNSSGFSSGLVSGFLIGELLS